MVAALELLPAPGVVARLLIEFPPPVHRRKPTMAQWCVFRGVFRDVFRVFRGVFRGVLGVYTYLTGVHTCK